MLQIRRPPAAGGWLLAVAGLVLNAVLPFEAVLRTLAVDARQLARLSFQHCSLSPAAFQTSEAVAQLPAAQRLILRECTAGGADGGGGGTMPAVLQGMLASMPSVTAVNLMDLALPGGLPDCMVQRASLLALQCSGCQLSSLPAGPYLAGGCCLRTCISCCL